MDDDRRVVYKLVHIMGDELVSDEEYGSVEAWRAAMIDELSIWYDSGYNGLWGYHLKESSDINLAIKYWKQDRDRIIAANIDPWAKTRQLVEHYQAAFPRCHIYLPDTFVRPRP